MKRFHICFYLCCTMRDIFSFFPFFSCHTESLTSFHIFFETVRERIWVETFGILQWKKNKSGKDKLRLN